MKPIIIIGAGMAGYTVARELRKRDKATPLLILSADDGDFYAKPMLSNAFMQGKSAQQLISQTCSQMAAQLDATIRPHTRVSSIDTARRIVHTEAGPLDYARLVLAVGAQAIRIAPAGNAAEQVLSVNHLSDYSVFRDLIAQAQAQRKSVAIAIIGAGLIGCEFANDLATAGHAVTLIDPNPRPMAALAAADLSAGLQQALSDAGVAFRLGTSAVRIEREQNGFHLTLSDGGTLQADLVLSAIGLRPELQLAQAAQLATARGILVDGYGQTSAPDVYALGDCAEYAMSDGATQVLPYIAPLMAAARAIAGSLTGERTAIDWKPAPVIVKTPCYPLALMPPSMADLASGAWQAQTEGTKTICRFLDAQGVLRGFGVAPQDAASRQALLAALGTAVAPVDLAA